MLRQGVSQIRSLLDVVFVRKHLLLANTVSSGVLLAAGDAIQQRIENAMGHKHKYDFARTGRMFAVGLLVGPPHHYFYLWLDRVIKGTSLRAVGTKIMADQLVAAPMFAVLFFYGMGVLQGNSLKQCWTEFASKFPTVYLFDWCLWPPTQYINFMYVPSRFRVLYVNVITVVWDVFLSYIKHYDQLKEEGKSS